MNNDFERFPKELSGALFMDETVFLKGKHKNKKYYKGEEHHV